LVSTARYDRKLKCSTPVVTSLSVLYALLDRHTRRGYGEANNDAGLAAHPSRRWATNCVHFQLAMLAYNLNCWLMLFNREEQAKLEELKHTTLATARLRFLQLSFCFTCY
jgi:hypothetical protein